MKSSCHSLIPFLPFLLNLRLPSSELDPILDDSLKRRYLSLYNPSTQTTQKIQPLYFSGLFTDPLPTNERLIFARICLPSYCLAMGLYVTVLFIFLLFFFFCINTDSKPVYRRQFDGSLKQLISGSKIFKN
jgi:hypothetical protein